MRLVAPLAMVALALAAVGAWRGWGRSSEAGPLPAAAACREFVELEEPTGRRVVCLDDRDLDRCRAGTALRSGRRYRDCLDVGPASGAALVARGQPVSINAASAEDLRALPGVGPRAADRLVQGRAKDPYCNSQDLKRVEGIGDKKASQLAPLLDFDAPQCPVGTAPAPGAAAPTGR